MLIIDTETHILIFAQNHLTTGTSMIYGYAWHEHSADLLVAEMDNAGVDKTFLISYDTEDICWYLNQTDSSMEDFAGGKKYTKRGWRQYPDRFYWFSTLKDPRLHPSVRLVKEDLAEGARGIKVFPGYIQIDLNHAEIMKAFQVCQDSGAVVLISFEDLKPPQTMSLSQYLIQLDEVLTTFPQINFCLLHSGCADPLSKDIEGVYRLMEKQTNLYLSTAVPGQIWDDGTEYPFPNYLKRIESLVKHLGTERIMWATDWPWFEWAFKYQQAVNAILRHAHFLSESQIEDFMGRSALRLLGEAA